MLRRIFGPKRTEVTEEWTKLHKEQLNDKYHSPNITRVIKLSRLRWTEHVELWGEERCILSFGVET